MQTGTGPPTKGLSQDGLFNLFRYSHIFASVVREILEVKLVGEVSPDSLTLSQFHLLKLIALNGQHQMGAIAEFLGVSPAAATKNIDKLEGLGLVARNPSELDRRATLISCSTKGRHLVEKYEHAKEERIAPVLAAFKPEELELFTRLLERFALFMLRSEEGDEGLCLRCSAHYDDNCPVHRLRDGCPYQKSRHPVGRAAAGSAA